MKKLDLLIKIKKRDIDEIRNQIIEFEKIKIGFLNAQQVIKENLIIQTDFIKNNSDVYFAFMPFYENSKLSLLSLKNKINHIDSQIETLKNMMIDLFKELKQYEIIINNQNKIAQNKIKLEEEKNLDEIGINSFLKNNDETV